MSQCRHRYLSRSQVHWLMFRISGYVGIAHRLLSRPHVSSLPLVAVPLCLSLVYWSLVYSMAAVRPEPAVPLVWIHACLSLQKVGRATALAVAPSLWKDLGAMQRLDISQGSIGVV